MIYGAKIMFSYMKYLEEQALYDLVLHNIAIYIFVKLLWPYEEWSLAHTYLSDLDNHFTFAKYAHREKACKRVNDTYHGRLLSS